MSESDERRIEWMALEQIHKAPRNPKRHDPDRIRRSIDRYGVVELPTLDERTGRLVAGHGRLKAFAAAKAIGDGAPWGVRTNDSGDWLVPVLRGWASKDDAEAEAYLITSNELTIMSGWDERELLPMLSAMDDELADIAGFDYDRLLELEARFPDPRSDPDAAPPEPLTPRTKQGDLYLLGRHRLLCGDSTVPADVARVMGGRRATLMATDPPYLVDYDGTNHPQSRVNRERGANPNKEWRDYVEGDNVEFFAGFIAAALAEALVEAPVIYQWHASRRQCDVEAAWASNDLLVHQTIIWVKAHAILGRSMFMWQHEPCFFGWVTGHMPPSSRRPPANAASVWEISQQGESDGIHPTQKPVELFARPVLWHTEPGEWIFEPFCGSGTALIAADMHHRSCAAIEKAPSFCDVICRRFQEFTGTVPILEESGEEIDFTSL